MAPGLQFVSIAVIGIIWSNLHPCTWSAIFGSCCVPHWSPSEGLDPGAVFWEPPSQTQKLSPVCLGAGTWGQQVCVIQCLSIKKKVADCPSLLGWVVRVWEAGVLGCPGQVRGQDAPGQLSRLRPISGASSWKTGPLRPGVGPRGRQRWVSLSHPYQHASPL